VQRGGNLESAPRGSVAFSGMASTVHGVDAAAVKRKSMLDGTDLYEHKSSDLSGSGIVPVIREAVTVAPDQRTEEQVNTILKFAHEVEFFTQLSAVQQFGLCRTMRFAQVKKSDEVFSYGDEGDMFYIVLFGRLEVRVPDRAAPCPKKIHADLSDCTCLGREMIVVGHLEQGNGFGELALINDKPRAATIVALEETYLLVVTRSDYKKFAGQHHKEYLAQRVKFLKQVPQLESALEQGLVSEQDVITTANCLTEASYYGNAIVAEQGELVDRIIFVRAGQLTIVRALDVDTSVGVRRRQGQTNVEESTEADRADSVLLCGASSQDQETDVAAESVGLLQTSPLVPTKPAKPRKKLLRVGVVGAYQYFGEQQFYQGETFPASLVSEAKAVIYVATKQDVMRRIPKSVLSALLSGTEVDLVDDGKLLEMYAHTERWKAYCQDLHEEALSRREDPTKPRLHQHLATVRGGRSVVLTHKEHEFFGDASARFLRRYGEVGRDKRLQNSLKEARGRGTQTHNSLDNADEPAPMNFRFENQWSRMGEGIIVQDLEQVLQAQQNHLPGMGRGTEKRKRRTRNLARGLSFARSESRVSEATVNSQEQGSSSGDANMDSSTQAPSQQHAGISAQTRLLEEQPQDEVEVLVPKQPMQAKLPCIAPGMQRHRPEIVREVLKTNLRHGPGRRRLVHGHRHVRFPPYNDRSFRKHLI